MGKLRAFSLIELMVVIAIVALLSVVAVPAYKDYATKAEVASTIPVMNQFMQEVTIFYNKQGSLPTKMSQLGHSEGGGTINSGHDFSTSDYNSGAIVELGVWGYSGCAAGSAGCAWVGLDKNIFGLDTDPQLHFNIYLNNTGSLQWKCTPYGTNNLDAKYIPSTCQ